MFDCCKCGACCAVDSNHSTWAHKPIENSDVNLNFLKINGYADTYLISFHQMKITPDHKKCVALEGNLGETVKCKVYDHRPNICKKFEVGSALCLDARSKFLPKK